MVVEKEETKSPGKPSDVDTIGEEVVLSDKDAKKAEEDKDAQALKEFGGPVSLFKLLSLASRGELFVLFIGVLGAIGHGSGQPLLCLMFGDLIDSLAGSIVDPDAFLVEVGNVAARFTYIGLGVTFVGTLQGLCFPYFAESQVNKMRPLYFEAALYRDVGWFDTHDTASLPTEMGADIDSYQEAFGNILGASLMSFSCVCLGIGFGIYLSWQVGLVMLFGTLPVMAAGGVVMGKAVMDLMQETQGPYVKAATIVMETLYAVRTVVAFGGEQRELQRYDAEIEKARWGGVKSRAKTGFGMGYIWMSYFAGMALAFYFGMRLRYDGQDLSVGAMMASFFCILTSGFTVGQIPPGIVALFKAKRSTARFWHILEHDSEIQRRKADTRKEMGPIESLSLDEVHFAYPARPDIRVLNGLSLVVQKGQKVAVVGESGSGKSTVMALLERFYDPLAGRVLVNGCDLKEFCVKSFRSQVGYVGQEPVLFATSVRANIMQGSPNTADADLQRVAQHAQLSFIEDLPDGFDTWVGSGGSQFSGGQKQRIAIARALIKNPSVLFLDEATSALDGRSEKMIQNTIDKIGNNSELGITIVTIAHRLSTVKNSDVIYVLSGGRVAEQGSHKELTAKEGGLYQALAAAQEMAEDDQSGMQRSTSPESAEEKEKQTYQKLAPGTPNREQDEEARAKEIGKKYKVPLFRLAGFCKQEWFFFPLGVLGALGSGAGFPVLGTFFLVDAMVAFLRPISIPEEREKMRDEVEEAAMWFVIVGAIKWLCTFIQFTSFGILGESMTKRARVAMLTSVFRQEVGFHDNPENTPGRLAKALQIYAYRVQALCTSVGDLSDALCSVVLGIGLAFLFSWEMTLAMLLSIPVFALAQGIQVMVLMGTSKAENAYLRNAQQILSDALINSRTVQAAGCEQDCLSLYRRILAPASAGGCKKHIFGGFAFGLSNGVMFWVCSGGFWFMGWLIEEGKTDFADGQRSFMGVLYAGLGAGMAFALTGNVTKAKIAAHDMFELIDRKSSIDGLNPTGVEPAKDSTESRVGRFEFTDVHFFYPFRPDVKVLKGVNFTVAAGQSVGICGPSGGGKSTVMSMIQRFYDPQSGSVLVGESRMPLDSINIRWWRQQIGFVGQEPILFDTTVLENVKYGLLDDETVSEERLEECKRMAHLTFLDSQNSQGWQTQVGPRGARLSGGQKQRVAICRALIRNPPVLLLDEATSALDSQSEKVVSDALENARQGRTSFAIAHRLSTISDCDVILVVAEGKIVEKGSHWELLEEKGVYWKLQAQVSSTEACAGANLQNA